MTQHELARAADLPQSTIARIEAGTVVPRTATLMKLLQAVGHALTVEPIGPAVDVDAIRRHLRRTPVAQRTRRALGRRGKDRSTSPMRLILRLGWFGVPFIVVGDVAEVVHGRAGIIGPSVEVCMDSTDLARERLARALDDLGRRAAGARLSVVAETAAGDDFALLAANATRMLVSTGMTARVASLPDLIRARRAKATPADLAVAAELSTILGDRPLRE
jgi:transcriptional regulator with XRE-family HTH domain